MSDLANQDRFLASLNKNKSTAYEAAEPGFVFIPERMRRSE